MEKRLNIVKVLKIIQQFNLRKFLLLFLKGKYITNSTASSSTEPENNDELEQITIARALLNYRLKEKMAMSNPNALIPFPKKFQFQNPRPTNPQPRPATSKILPLICQKTAHRSRHPAMASSSSDHNSNMSPLFSAPENRWMRRPKFPAARAAPYVPIRHMRSPCQGIAPPVTVRTAIPVFSPAPKPHGRNGNENSCKSCKSTKWH